MDEDSEWTHIIGRGVPTVLVGAVALAIGAVAGILIGFVGGIQTASVSSEPAANDEVEVEVAVVDEEDELAMAQDRVAELEREVAERQRKVRELQAEMARRPDDGGDMSEELQTMMAQLADAQGELTEAVREKDGLLGELRLTEAELEQTREDALYNRFQDFIKGSQLEICSHGSRRKLGRCRELVMAAMSTADRRDRFAQCVRSGQAAPVVMKLDRGAAMPDYSEMIDEADRVTRGWMIVFCDPSLPEPSLGRLAEGRLPGGAEPTEASAGSAVLPEPVDDPSAIP